MKFHKRKVEEDISVEELDNYNKSNDEMLKAIVQMNRLDLLIDIDLRDLLKINEGEETYLDYLLQSFLKDNNSVNISTIKFSFDKTDINNIASLYLTYAKYDLVEYLPRLDTSILLKTVNNTNLLEILIRKNHLLTLNRILTERDLEDKDILVTLGLNHINLRKPLNIEVLPDNLIDACCEWYSNKYDNIQTDEEFERKLDRLREVLLGRQSERDLVESVIKSYRVYYMNNKEYAIKELDNVVADFSKMSITIKYGKSPVYYRNSRTLFVNSNNIPMLSHEFGHAVFTSISRISYSDEFESVCDKVRNDKSVINKLGRFTEEYYIASRKLEKDVNESWKRQKYIKLADEKEITQFISQTKEMQRKNLLERGYDKTTVDTLLDLIYTKEEYFKSFENTRKKELKNALFGTEYCHIRCMADIIDAVYKGNFFDEKIKGEDYKVIKGTSGHGLNYYNSRRENAFNEVMANYSQLLKSFYYNDCMKLLSFILGNEFVETMKNIYYEEVLERTKNVERSI